MTRNTVVTGVTFSAKEVFVGFYYGNKENQLVLGFSYKEYEDLIRLISSSSVRIDGKTARIKTIPDGFSVGHIVDERWIEPVFSPVKNGDWCDGE